MLRIRLWNFMLWIIHSCKTQQLWRQSAGGAPKAQLTRVGSCKTWKKLQCGDFLSHLKHELKPEQKCKGRKICAVGIQSGFSTASSVANNDYQGCFCSASSWCSSLSYISFYCSKARHNYLLRQFPNQNLAYKWFRLKFSQCTRDISI